MAASPKVRSDFLEYLGPDFATLLVTTASPLHIRFAPGLAPLAQRLRDALKLKRFEGRITTGTQNAAAGASPSSLSAPARTPSRRLRVAAEKRAGGRVRLGDADDLTPEPSLYFFLQQATARRGTASTASPQRVPCARLRSATGQRADAVRVVGPSVR